MTKKTMRPICAIMKAFSPHRRAEPSTCPWNNPDAKMHATYHQRLLDRAEEVRRACGQIDSQEAFEECCDEMMTFLVDDVVRGDMKMKSFLETNGLPLPD